MKCPKCESMNVVPILCGMPRGDALEMAERGEEQQTELELSGLNPDELERMNGEERRMVLVGAGLDPDVYDF